MSKNPPPSDLIQAASGLEEELDRFAKLSRAIEKEPLNSRKSLERAADSLSSVAASDEALQIAMRTLMAALTALRERHEGQTKVVQERAEEIRQRGEAYKELLGKLATLGANAGEVNSEMITLANGNEDKGAIAGVLDAVLEKMSGLAKSVEEFQQECTEKHFEDIEREADTLRAQLVKGRSKLAQLQKDLLKQR
jgi:hypothetical protein